MFLVPRSKRCSRPRGDLASHNETLERNYISHFHRRGSPSINTQTANNSFIGRIQSRRRRRRWWWTSESTAGSAVMELRKTDSEDLLRANCTGAVHTDAPDRSFCSSTDHRHRPASYGCILKLQLGQRASRLTECSSLLNCICTRESYLHLDLTFCEFQSDFRKT